MQLQWKLQSWKLLFAIIFDQFSALDIWICIVVASCFANFLNFLLVNFYFTFDIWLYYLFQLLFAITYLLRLLPVLVTWFACFIYSFQLLHAPIAWCICFYFLRMMLSTYRIICFRKWVMTMLETSHAKQMKAQNNWYVLYSLHLSRKCV